MLKKKKEVVEQPKKKDEDWMTKKWRPMMAMMYMTCCLFDFALFPIMFTVVQFWEVQAANDAFRQWVPITLQGGGLFHVAMGGVLGVTAYGRTQEKVAGAASNTPAMPAGLPSPQLSSAPSAYNPGAYNQPSYSPAPTGFNGTSSSDFNQQPVAVTVGFGGKPAPAPAPQPLL